MNDSTSTTEELKSQLQQARKEKDAMERLKDQAETEAQNAGRRLMAERDAALAELAEARKEMSDDVETYKEGIAACQAEMDKAKEWADKCEASQRAWQEQHAQALEVIDQKQAEIERLSKQVGVLGTADYQARMFDAMHGSKESHLSRIVVLETERNALAEEVKAWESQLSAANDQVQALRRALERARDVLRQERDIEGAFSLAEMDDAIATANAALASAPASTSGFRSEH